MVCIEQELANRQIKMSNDVDSECRMQKHNKIRSHLGMAWIFLSSLYALNAFVELIKLSIAVALDRTNTATIKKTSNIGDATNIKNDAMNCRERWANEIEFVWNSFPAKWTNNEISN